MRRTQIDLTHRALQVERRLVNIVCAIQVLAVIALALLLQLALGKCKRHIEEYRQVGLRNCELLVLGEQNPLMQSCTLLLALGLIKCFLDSLDYRIQFCCQFGIVLAHLLAYGVAHIALCLADGC